jgi:hypothetical protein
MHGLTFSDVDAFIAERCRDLRCPACGDDKIEPAAEPSEQPIALLFENWASYSSFAPPGYLRVFALNCVTCGYVIVFRLEVLEKWVKARATARRLLRGEPVPPQTSDQTLLNAPG